MFLGLVVGAPFILRGKPHTQASHIPSQRPAISNQNPSPLPKVPQLPQWEHMEVRGDEDCKTRTAQALDLLEKKAPEHHRGIVKYVGVVECAEQGSGMYAWESPPRFQVGKATYQVGTVWYASVIAHDACHSKQYYDDRLPYGPIATTSGKLTQEESEEECLQVQYDVLTKIGAPQNYLDHVKNGLSGRYWEVDYSERWW